MVLGFEPQFKEHGPCRDMTKIVKISIRMNRLSIAIRQQEGHFIQEMIRIARFRDRTEAGQLLAKRLRKYANCRELLVLALPRGGVPVGFEVAKALKAPLDIFVVRKLGVPGEEELAMGAIAPGGIRVLDEEIIRLMGDLGSCD